MRGREAFRRGRRVSSASDAQVDESLRALARLLARQVDLAVSEAITAETLRVLTNKFERAPEWLAEADRQLRVIIRLVHPTEVIQAIEADPTDDRILECAIAADAEVIVSGDSHLLSLGVFRGIPIRRVAAFPASLEDHARA